MIKGCANDSLIIFQTGHTALQRAAAEGHIDVVKHLIGRGAPVDHQDDVVRNFLLNNLKTLYI